MLSRESESLKGNDENNINEFYECTSSESSSAEPSIGSLFETNSEQICCIVNILKNLGLTPLNKKLNHHQLKKEAEKLLTKATLELSNKLNNAYDLDMTVPTDFFADTLVEDCRIFHNILKSMQKKYEECKTVNEKIQLLTILPPECTLKMLRKYFNITEYMYYEFKSSVENNGDYYYYYIYYYCDTIYRVKFFKSFTIYF